MSSDRPSSPRTLSLTWKARAWPPPAVAWETPGHPRELALGEIHLWSRPFDPGAEASDDLLDQLSDDEIERADGFYNAEKRARFVVVRATLRATLSRYCQVDPGEIRFDYNAHGKPELAGRAAAAGLRFSVSHAHRLALIGVTSSSRVGVDLEWTRRKLAVEPLAGRFLSLAEYSEYQKLPEPSRRDGFFAYWTRKEAFIKAIGRGLSYPVRQVSILNASHSPSGMGVQAEEGDPLPGWSVIGFEPQAAYLAALAVEGPIESLCFWRAS